jgi:hypothetical protein
MSASHARPLSSVMCWLTGVRPLDQSPSGTLNEQSSWYEGLSQETHPLISQRIRIGDVARPQRFPRTLTSVSLVSALGEPPGGIEPPTPSLPSMRRSFTSPRGTSRDHTTAQVRGAVEGCVVGRGEVASGVVSGKSLARLSAVAWDVSAASFRVAPGEEQLAPLAQCCHHLTHRWRPRSGGKVGRA